MLTYVEDFGGTTTIFGSKEKTLLLDEVPVIVIWVASEFSNFIGYDDVLPISVTNDSNFRSGNASHTTLSK